jgi:hypothetical protein
MKKLLLLTLFVSLFLGCEKEEHIHPLEPTFELEINGNNVNPFEFYRVVNTYGGVKEENGVITKLFVLYLQRDEGDPRLDVEHFAVILKDVDGLDNGQLLDIGMYQNPIVDSKSTQLEIPGDQDYIVYANTTVADVHDGLICLEAEGEFWNPYQQSFYTVKAKLENYPIGQDVTATPYAYLLN